MAVQETYLQIIQGETFALEATVFAGCDPFDLTGYTSAFVVTDSAGATVTLDTTITITAATGVINLVVAADDTADLDVATYTYRWTITAGPVVYVVLRGSLGVVA